MDYWVIVNISQVVRLAGPLVRAHISNFVGPIYAKKKWFLDCPRSRKNTANFCIFFLIFIYFCNLDHVLETLSTNNGFLFNPDTPNMVNKIYLYIFRT